MDANFIIFAIVIIPLLSVCLGFTVHFAVRPLMESLLDAMHEMGKITSGGETPERVERLEAEIRELRQELRRLGPGRPSDRLLAEPPSERQ